MKSSVLSCPYRRFFLFLNEKCTANVYTGFPPTVRAVKQRVELTIAGSVEKVASRDTINNTTSYDDENHRFCENCSLFYRNEPNT